MPLYSKYWDLSPCTQHAWRQKVVSLSSAGIPGLLSDINHRLSCAAGAAGLTGHAQTFLRPSLCVICGSLYSHQDEGPSHRPLCDQVMLNG